MPWAVVLVVVLLLSLQSWRKVVYHRTKQYSDIPQLPASQIWGHLSTVYHFMKTNTSHMHFDALFQSIRERLDNPPLFLLDLRPFSLPTVVVCDHGVAEQISQSSKLFPYSLPKSPTLEMYSGLTGHTSIIVAEKEEWKAMRKLFSPVFSHKRLTAMIPAILDKTELFMAHLDRLASTGEEFSLDYLCSTLTLDITGAVTMDLDLGAQLGEKNQSQIVRLFRELRTTYALDRGIWAFLPSLRKSRITRLLDTHIKAMIKDVFKEQQANPKKQSCSVLSLCLAEKKVLTPDILNNACDQVKAFLFAGHDTTSVLLQWAFYELSRSPCVFNSVRLELDSIFGPESSPGVIRDKILHYGAESLRKMFYTSALIKEVLRLHPPGATARYAPPNSGTAISLPSGQSLCLDGCVLYSCQSVIQRDRAVYGDTASQFFPERWLGSTNTPAPSSHIPPGAWRPFERGPRKCIGQELANMEALVILACAARRYDWEKVGLGAIDSDGEGGPVLKTDGQYVVRSEVYSTLEITSKPVDGMRMRVRLAGTDRE